MRECDIPRDRRVGGGHKWGRSSQPEPRCKLCHCALELGARGSKRVATAAAALEEARVWEGRDLEKPVITVQRSKTEMGAGDTDGAEGFKGFFRFVLFCFWRDIQAGF